MRPSNCCRRLEADAAGKKIADVLPMLLPRSRSARSRISARRRSQEIAAHHRRRKNGLIAVRVTREQAGPGDVGWVVTFDDVTELVSAQRTSGVGGGGAPHRA